MSFLPLIGMATRTPSLRCVAAMLNIASEKSVSEGCEIDKGEGEESVTVEEGEGATGRRVRVL